VPDSHHLPVSGAPLTEQVLTALGDVRVQDRHPYLPTETGMAAIRAVTGPDAEHIRTAEYVAARVPAATGADGDRGVLLARAGHPDTSGWHLEELRIAGHWAVAGCAVSVPVSPSLTAAKGGSVSLWQWVDHDPHARVDPFAAGRLLARLHCLPVSVWDDDPHLFDRVTFRAPAKIARRLMGLAGLADLSADRRRTLVGLGRAVGVLAAAAAAESDRVCLHGDFQAGNWLPGPGGPVAIDFATSCLGPRLWDLTLFESRCHRPGYAYGPGDWAMFADAYGVAADVLHATAAAALRAVATVVVGLRREPGAPAAWAAAADLLRRLDT
jgi:hypothetical protein